MTHTFAYRCGGSDGIAFKELTFWAYRLPV